MTRPDAAGHEEGGRRHRPLVVEAVAGLQLAGPGHRPHPVVVGHREVLEHVHRHRHHLVPSGPHRQVVQPGSQTRTLYIVCIALYILSVLTFCLVTTAADARDTRDRILDATIRLLRRQGYTATGIKQIVAEGDAPLGSVYHYFPGGKEQIGIEALARSGERIRSHHRPGRRRPRPPALRSTSTS